MPLIDFFATMVPRDLSYQEEQNFLTKSRLKLLIPYTIVFGVDEYPILYYTDEDGFIRRIDNVTTPQIIKKLTLDCGPEDLCVVQKNPLSGESITNNAILLNPKQLKTTLENQSRGKVVFQRFVKSKGPKATITRVCWRRDAPAYAYMLSNKKSFDDQSIKEAIFRLLTNTEDPQSLNVFHLKGPAIKDLVDQVQDLVTYSERYSRLQAKYSELVCDFIRDDDGQWFFIQVKGLKIIKPPAHIANNAPTISGEGDDLSKSKKSKSKYMKLKECKMCLNMYPPKELLYQMSFKMIYATESHLKQRAVKLPWFDRPEFNSITDTSMWYEPHPVCKNCFDMYIQEQKLSKVEVEFAKAIGIPVNEKANENASILSTLTGKMNTARRSAATDDGSTGVIPPQLQMYRFIIYLNELRNIPDIIPDRFSLRIKVFKNELVIPLRVETVNHRKIFPVGKLRVYYFFAEDDSKFRKWLDECQSVTVNIFAGDERLGYANLNLAQFSSGLIDKLDYMVLFSSPKLKLCSLRATLGFVKMEPMDLSNVKLEPWSGIYIPPDDFFTAHPLPDEWMEVIPQLSSQLPIDKLAKMDPTLKKNKERPSTAPSSTRHEPEIQTADDYIQNEMKGARPVSKSQRLVMRTTLKSERRYSEQQGQVPQTPSHNNTTTNLNSSILSGKKMRPLSKVFSPIYSSRLGTPSKRYRDYLYQISKTNNSKLLDRSLSLSPTRNLEDSKNQEEQNDEKETQEEKKINSDEFIWSFSINIGSVYDLSSSVDEPWIMKFTLFGDVTREYESYQLIQEGPLLYDIEDTIYFSCTEQNLMNYFGKERVFKLILVPKFGGEERTAAIDLRQFQKADSIELVAQIEQIRADEIDNTKFMEAQSDDDEYMDEDEEEGEDKKDTVEENKDPNATVKVFMNITKFSQSREYENLPIASILSEYDLKVLKKKPNNVFH